jgi:hypothetical protein
MSRVSALLALTALVAGSLAGCQLAAMVGLDAGSPECAAHPQADLCEQVLSAVRNELGAQAEGGAIRVEPVQCAHGNCWTWAQFTPAGGGSEWMLSVDWLPNGEISIGYFTE